MKIEPFVYQWSPAGTITIIVGTLLGIAILVGGIAHTRSEIARIRREKSQNPQDPSQGAIIGVILGLAAVGLSLFAGLSTDYGNKSKAEITHYSAEADRIQVAYPQIADAGIDLFYHTSGYYDSNMAGNITPVIRNPGKFHPIGTAYERTADGLDRSNLVAILNDDWTLEIFEARDADELVKIEPQGVAQ